MADEQQGNYLFMVPNDEEGRYFLHLCRKYARNGVHFRQRGNSADRQKLVKKGKTNRFSIARSVPLELADRIRIYACTYEDGETNIFGPRNLEWQREDRERRWEVEGKLSKAQQTIARALATAQEQLAD